MNRSAPWCFRAALLLLLGVAAALRFWQIGRLEMWLDECHTVMTATDPAGVLAALRRDTNAPLYFLLMKAWIALFGVEGAAVRALSAVLGVAQLAALAGWVRALSGSRRAGLWAAGLGAVTPIHLYYSQEARGYTLAWLLATLAGWTLTMAISPAREIPSGRLRLRTASLWLFHALVLAAGFLTHDLMLAFLPAAWLGALVLRARRADWVKLSAAHGTALLLAAPYLLISLTQPKDAVAAWVRPLWEATPPALALPRSLETFLIGGNLPDYLRTASPGGGWRFAALAAGLLMAAGLISRLLPRRVPAGTSVSVPALTEDRSAGRAAGVLLTFFLMPLLLPWVYSCWKNPIYLVGRYDTLALPAFLGLCGLGASALQAVLVRRSRLAGEVLPPLAIVTLAVAALAPRFRGPVLDSSVTQIQSRRAAALIRYSRQSDTIVCMGQEGLKLAYQMLRHGRRFEFQTFPPDTKEHLGWFDPAGVAARGREQLTREADRVLDPILAGQGPRRMWVVMDPFSGRPPRPGEGPNHYDLISDTFLDQAEARGMRFVSGAGELDGLGLMLYEERPDSDLR